MQKHYNYLDIDLDNKNNYRRLNAMQGDIKTRYILVNLYSNNLAYDLSNCTVKIYGLKRDKTIFFNNAVITNAKLGQFEIELTNQALAIAGELKIQILVLGTAGEKLTSSAFFIDVGESIIDENAIESTNEFGALTESLTKVNEWDSYFEETSGKIEEKYTERLNEVDSQIKDITTQFSYCSGKKFEIEKHLNIFNNTIANSSSIYWCWVIRVDDKISNPLAKYYMYYSTDHEGVNGFISLAYSNDLLNGWKNYGKIFKNGSYETETPSVVWDEKNRKFIMYFHSAGSYEGEAQTSYYTTSSDGINFNSNVTKLLNLDLSRLSGDGHNGYFHPFKIGNKYVAYHLLGGGNYPRFAISYSDDGYNWITDHKQLGYLCLNNNRFMSVNHCTIINKFGIDWLLGINTNFTSGSTPKNAYVGIVPMQNLYTTIGYDEKLFELNGSGESVNLRQVSVFQEDSKIYVFYQCDNKLHCVVIK